MTIARIGSPILVNAVAGTSSHRPSVAALSDGRFAVSFESSGIKTRVFNADGTPRTGEISLAFGGSDSSVSALAGGRYVVVYNGFGSGTADTSGTSIRAQILNADGTVFRSEFLVNSATLYDQTEAAVRTLADGRFIVTYTDASGSGGVFGVTDIRARIFNADGTPSVPEFVVNTATPERQNESAVTVLADGRILVSYSAFTPPTGNTPGVTVDRWDIMGRILNPDGTTSVPEFRLNGTVYLFQQDSSVAALSNGGFVVTYNNDDGNFGGVSARIFNANGQQTVAEFRVNASTDGLQRDSQVAALPDGRFVVIFADNTMGVAPAVATTRAVIYNNDGTVAIPEFVVQTSDFFMQDSSIAVLADGRFVVTVRDFSDAAVDGVPAGVYAHIFDPRRFDGTANTDSVTGGNLDDTILGYGGNDVIYGRGGNDFLVGGEGADYIDGGDGYDLASYAYATSGVDVRLYAGTGTVGEAAYDNIVRVEALQGSAFSDTLMGDGGSNVLYGYEGDDYLDGVGGADFLRGEGGHDTFNLRDGAENVEGGAGWDIARYDYAPTAVFASLGSPSQNTGWAAGDTYAGVEALAGSAFGDVLVGDALSNALYGWTGSDALYGAAANDTLAGGTGSDVINGGGGRDVATFDVTSTAATRTRGAGWTWNIASGGETDNLFGVEVAQFTDRNVALREAARSDVSGDGASDLVFYNAAIGHIGYYEMNPGGGYAWRNIGTVGAGYTPATGDFNADGEADVLWFNGTSLSTYDVNPGGGGYVWRAIGSVAPGHQAIVGDYDGDGTSDIAFLNTATGALSWYDINPSGGYVWRNIGAVGLGYTPLTGDFNGDGETDIGWFNGTSLSYYDIGNAGGHTWRDIGAVGPGHKALTGDFNNDGTTDVAFINQTTNAISFYAVNPNGGYTWHNIGSVAPGYTATAADVTNDGKTDIVFSGAGGVSYYDVGPTGGYTWHNIGAVGAGYVISG